MKLSGIGHFAEDEPYYESALPFTKRTIREFGTDRMFWGSGSPKNVDVHMALYSTEDLEKVKGGNIQKLLDWKLLLKVICWDSIPNFILLELKKVKC